MVKRHIYRLAKDIGPRGSATAQERKAAEYCCEVLENCGYQVQLQTFRALTTFSWLHICFFLWPLTAWLAQSWPLSMVGAVLFFLDLNTVSVLSRVFPKGASQNVIARHPAGSGQQVVLVAHLDSSKAGLNFSPKLVKGFRTSFLLMVWSHIFSPLLLVASSLYGGWWRIVALLPPLYLAFASLTLFHREIWNHYTNGANDNASGVAAVLAVAEKLGEELPEGMATCQSKCNLVRLSATLVAFSQ